MRVIDVVLLVAIRTTILLILEIIVERGMIITRILVVMV